MLDAAGARDGGTTAAETIYHVRVIQPWALESSSAAAIQERARFSFFGLELELMGFQSGDGIGSSDPLVPVTCPLHFITTASVGNALQGQIQLASIVGPFKIRVISKLAPANPAAMENDKLVLQKLIAVQPDNLLLEINSVRFLQMCSTGTGVHKCLLRVLTRVSLARPFELTFQRHNHPQAAAKIVPFAARADVQVAQVTQYKKMQEQEAQVSGAIRRKKQFITQQMDYEQEHYLFDHIGAQLFVLYEEIMANGQWQAYEFDQVLWYYHAASSRLYAEHPMRNSEKIRQLIGTTQLRTRFAVQKMQHATRVFLRRKRIIEAVVDRHLLDRVWVEVWQQAWTKIWTDDVLPLYTSKSQNNVKQEVEQLWNNWKNRNLQPVKADIDEVPVTTVVSSAPQLADVVKNGIPPSIPPMLNPTTPPAIVVEDKQMVDPNTDDDAVPVTALVSSGPQLADIVKNGIPTQKPATPPIVVAEVKQRDDPSTDIPPSEVRMLEPVPDPIESIELPMSDATPTAKAEQTTESANEDLSPKDKAVESRDDDDDDVDDDEDDPVRWRGYLTLLKTNIKQKKASPLKKHRVQNQIKQTRHALSDSASATTTIKLEKTHPHQVAYRETQDRFSFLPRVARNTSNVDLSSQPAHLSGLSSTRLGSSIAPPKAKDMAPFMLSAQQQFAHDRDHDEAASFLNSVLPTHVDPRKVNSSLCTISTVSYNVLTG